MKPSGRQISKARGWTKIFEKKSSFFFKDSKIKSQQSSSGDLFLEHCTWTHFPQSPYLLAVFVPALAAVLRALV